MDREQPVIELDSYRITDVDFTVYNGIEEIENKDIKHGDINATIGINEEYHNKAIVKLKTSIIDEDNLRVISVELSGFFTINEENEDKAKNYLLVNGSAILMPYLRAIISIISSLDNESAIVLPTMNTYNFEKKDKSE
ncbi:protein-export chaperone SecB [Marinilactibacillus sp. GCM10026970]|uniref:protein-export chaperone SecB n=1 Tax=Marinilactibacillus sp. GCM10026970 TaxID=3252642 RepID=UPI0036132632